MSDRPPFCSLLFASNGGRFDDLGRPYIPNEGEFVRGCCERAEDCGTCPLLIQWIQARMGEGWSVSWLCVHCIKEAVPTGKTADKNHWLAPGYYQSSRYREWEPEVVDEKSTLDGCTQCGYGSALLQLVLRR